MGRSWFLSASTREAVPARAAEALADQVVATGGGYGFGGGGVDPIDGDRNFRPLGQGYRQVPYWTRERARTYSVVAYRSNPMARAMIDTYTSFAVGDSGLSLSCPVPEVLEVADRFWRDQRNRLDSQERQRLLLQDHMLMGETALEMMSGSLTGRVRISPINTDRVTGVGLDRGNPLWPDRLWLRVLGMDPVSKRIVQPDDITGRRDGEVMWWVSWRALLTDQRGDPFLMPVLDDLDAYGQVVSNMIDRTALMRHLAFDVTMKGSTPEQIEAWIAARGGHHMPRSGTIEVHNESVEWKPIQGTVGADEDRTTAGTILTSVAAGGGLAKTWLSEPDGANRATSLSMAEPVRRRVGGVQAIWLEYQTDQVRFAVDRAVAAGELPVMVSAPTKGGEMVDVPPAQTVTVTGPEVAAADAQVTAQVLVNLSRALHVMRADGLLSREAAQVLAEKGWEQFAGTPYTSDLDGPDVDVDDVATAIDDAFDDSDPVGTPAQNLQGATP